jgi:hypothetical protein
MFIGIAAQIAQLVFISIKETAAATARLLSDCHPQLVLLTAGDKHGPTYPA